MELQKLVISLLLLVIVEHKNTSATGGNILEHLTEYELVFPQQQQIQNKKQINTIINKELGAHQHDVIFKVSLPTSGKVWTLDLEINKQLISSDFSQTIYTDEGLVSIPTTPKDLHHCNYHGKVVEIEDSDVALSTCDGLRGIIHTSEDSFYIEPVSDNYVMDGHVIYKPSNHLHFNQNKPGCGVESPADINTSVVDIADMSRLRRKRSTSRSQQKYFIETLIVMDKHNYDQFRTPEERQQHVKGIINMVDSYYKPLNFRVVLSHIEFWKKGNRADMTTNPYQALNAFMSYRNERLQNSDEVAEAWHRTDVSHLLFGRDFDGSIIGMAHVSAMCGYKSGSVNQDTYGKSLNVAGTVAHEMGHNFGMHHDTSNCHCSKDSDCIMAPQSGFRAKKDWSQCSLEYLDQGLKIGLGSCLMNVPDAGTLYGGPFCGNEIIERGEECDCGSVEDCTSKCCNASTCKLQPDAECDNGECCSGCKFQPSGTMCRSTNGNECDLSEFCSGASSFCPGNVFRADGSGCKESDSCHEGVCLTLDLQCKLIWGEDAWNGDDLCYKHVNKQGNQNGNCGKNRDGTFRRCKPEDVKCGKLNCHGDMMYPVLKGLDSKYNYLNTVRNVKYKCKTIASDGGVVVNINKTQDFDDTGLVQEGTGCGKNKVCRDHKCIPMTVMDCTVKCNQRGVCNNKGNCHCDDGWNPPFCLEKGRGGSIDSGPSSPQGTDKDTLLMIVLFVIVLPLILLSGTFIWYRKCDGRNQIKMWRRNREIRIQTVASAPEEKERLAAVAEMRTQERNAKATSATSSTSSLMMGDDQNLDLIKNSKFGGLRSVGTDQISGPLPVYSNIQPSIVTSATPRGSPRPNKPPPPKPLSAKPSPLPTRTPIVKPYQNGNKPAPPNQRPPYKPLPPNLRSGGSVTPPPPPPPANKKPFGGSMTPPPPPPSYKKPSPYGGGRKAFSKPTTPAKPSIPRIQVRGDGSNSGGESSFSVQALKARFDQV